MIDWCNRNGIATVLDIDDDLSSIHPNNPAAAVMNLHYNKAGHPDRRTPLRGLKHSWRWFDEAAKRATIVMCATDELAQVYGRWRPARVVNNYLHESYYGHPRVDSDVIAWPASLHSHPNDPAVLGTAMRDLVSEGAQFMAASDPVGLAQAFQITPPVHVIRDTPLEEWPTFLSTLGIGIVPLAKTKFNRSKSWLKGLELAACGVPFVASDRPEYRRLSDLGAGWLASRPSEWYAALDELRRNASKRAEFSESGRAVAETLSLEKNAWRWAEVWQEAYDLMHATAKH
jgi:hypothetical protein